MKVLISMPEDLLARVDREAKRRKLSRSSLLQEAAQRELGWPDTTTIDAAVAHARAALRGVGSFESVHAIRQTREELSARDRRR